MQRQFTLLVKRPGQGRGFAGKGAERFEAKTILGANLREAVEDVYQKDRGEKPKLGFRLQGPMQVTSSGCTMVKDFVVKCGVLEGDVHAVYYARSRWPWRSAGETKQSE